MMTIAKSMMMGYMRRDTIQNNTIKNNSIQYNSISYLVFNTENSYILKKINQI